MKIYFWQNMVAIHQVHCLRELVDRYEVHWMVDEELDEERAGQGWHRPDTGKIRVSTVKPDEVTRILESTSKDTLHIFSPRGCATGPTLLAELNRRNLRYAFIAEKPLGTGWRLAMRGLLYRRLAWQSRSRETFFAMGEVATAWYMAHGFRNVVPFGYTVADSVTPVSDPTPGGYRFICGAQLIARKDHTTLLRALAKVSGDWTLECIGRGPLAGELKSLAESLGVSGRVTWTESLPNVNARERIAQSDTLILSSEWEGWGAVVNEAVAEGTRVIVSDVCGASCLLGLGEVGDVFPTGDVDALADRLRRQMARGRVQPDERVTRRALHSKINGPAMAAYFEQVVAGEKPAAPWATR